MFSEKYSKFKDWLLEVDDRAVQKEGSNGRDHEYGSRKGGGIAHLNADREFTYADEEFLDTFGYPERDEILNTDWEEIYGVEAERLEDNVLPGLRQGDSWEGKVAGACKNGPELSHTLSLTKTSDGGVICEVKKIATREEVEIVREAKEEKLLSLREGLAELQESPSRYDIYNTTLRVLRETLDLDFCAMSVKEDELCLVKGQTDGISDSDYDLYSCIEKLSEQALSRGEIIWGEELSSIASPKSDGDGGYSYISVPIESIGAVEVFASGRNTFTEIDLGLMEIVGHHLYERITRAWLEEDLKTQAIHDQLTGLYNRHYFDQLVDKEVERAQRYGHSISFLMIDVNKFKDVNDRYSHNTGDQVLIQIGKILEENVREPDTVIRYGGDEFLVVMPETSSGADIVIQRLKDETRNWSQETELIDFVLTLSIGSAQYDPDEEPPVDQVLKKADKRMYEDKKSKERTTS